MIEQNLTAQERYWLDIEREKELFGDDLPPVAQSDAGHCCCGNQHGCCRGGHCCGNLGNVTSTCE